MPSFEQLPASRRKRIADRAKALIEETAQDAHKYHELKSACYILLNNIKNRNPKEDRKQWRCRDMRKIAKLIGFK